MTLPLSLVVSVVAALAALTLVFRRRNERRERWAITGQCRPSARRAVSILVALATILPGGGSLLAAPPTDQPPMATHDSAGVDTPALPVTGVSAPAAALTAPPVIAVAGGYYHALAALGDGTVAAWGVNRDGQGGTYDGDSCVREHPCLLAPRPVAGLPPVVAVAGGGDHNLALAADGTVWAWGANYSGQLGIPSVDRYGTATPTQVTGLTDVIAITAGYEHSLALRADGTVWAWGVNTDGTLGTTSADQCGRISNPYACAKSPAQIAGLTSVAAITAGHGYHSLALRDDGTVWAWGRGTEGQLGAVPNAVCDLLACARTPVQVPGLTGVTALAAGEYHSLAVRGDGSVWAWGTNVDGELGDGTIAPYYIGCGCRPTPAPVTGLTGATAVAAGSYHSAARTADGAIWAWGANFAGQLGGGSTDSATPVRVPGLGAASTLASGSQSLYAVLADGTLWNWGADFYAQLGRGTFDTEAVAPGPVAFPPPAPRLTASPGSLTFASRPIGTTSAAQVVTLTNSGTVAATLGAVTTSGDFAQANACPATLVAGAGCTISVTFSPTVAGAVSGTLRVVSNAAGSPLTLPLGGTGSGAAALTLSPATLTFPDQQINQASSPRTVTLGNSGTAPIALGARTIVGTNPTEFAIAATTCGATLAAGGSCTLTLTFTPTAAGQRAATLEIADDAPGNPHTVALSGRGVQPEIALSPVSLTFPKQALGTTSAARNVTITNTGTGPLTISALNADGDFRIDNTQTCFGTVQPGASCLVPILFTPTVVGRRTGTLTITDNAPGSPHTVALEGAGPTRGFIFVHGITEDYRNYDRVLTPQYTDRYLAKILNPLQGGAYRGTGTYKTFQGYEDRGADTTVGCTQRSLPSGYTIPTGFPVNLNTGTPICDSNDDIGVNAILLDQDVRDMAASGVDRVTIIANSMGGAITRAYLAYATATQSSSLSKLDGILFIHGAQDGSYVALAGQVGASYLISSVTGQNILTVATQTLPLQGINPLRPALQALTPRSAMYQFVNRPQNVPSYLFYANVYSDITLQPLVDIFGVQINQDPVPIGDFLFYPGSDDPSDTPSLGGARFRPSGTRGAIQYRLPGQASLAIGANMFNDYSTLAFTIPQSHFAIDRLIDQIPATGGRSLDQDLLVWLYDLDRQP
jgi:alpha-tubulin suppressor-like RCC1 family protein